MGNLTNVELTDMVLAYVRRAAAAGGNAVQAQILFREQFPDRVVLNSKTFTSTVQRLKDRKVPSKNGRSFPVCEG
jgi:hypothetical protein